MRFKHCPDCGAPLSSRDLGDDIGVPWCDQCGKPWFDMFPTCIIALVYNSAGKVLLLRQSYISEVYRNLVSGYMQPGESAEQTAVREILEETGLEVEKLTPAGTYWFARKGMLMIGFLALVNDSCSLKTSSEVDAASWHDASEAVNLVHPTGSVSHTLCSLFLQSGLPHP